MNKKFVYQVGNNKKVKIYMLYKNLRHIRWSSNPWCWLYAWWQISGRV